MKIKTLLVGLTIPIVGFAQNFQMVPQELPNPDNAPAPCTTEEFYAGKDPKPADRPAYSSLDNMALRNTVGDEMRPWQDALAQYMRTGLEKGIFE